MQAFMNWLAQAGIAAVLGVIVGAVVDPLVNHVLHPLWTRFRAKKA
jgi:uncharacterized membrane-anchored protein YhcB (DUF1043 family)